MRHLRPAAGDHHNAALPNLANKLLGRLWWYLCELVRRGGDTGV